MMLTVVAGCIDKTSSSELSEAINSMFRWYGRADKCYAYLSDVKTSHDVRTGTTPRMPQAAPHVFTSRWFTRGWTLQELIAPRDVYFYDQSWKLIGTRNYDLHKAISQWTGIDENVLLDSSKLTGVTVAKRMSWAAKRETSRKEDEAYCLLGIFGVNLPMLYGEEERAFVRLQEEIIRTTTDQSVFAYAPRTQSLLASSPRCFAACSGVLHGAIALSDESFELTNAGLRIRLPLVRKNQRQWAGILNCHQGGKRLTVSLENISQVVDPKNTTPDTYVLLEEQDLTYDDLDRTKTIEKSSIVIARQPPPELPQLLSGEYRRLWLRIANDNRTSRLMLGDCWPTRCWDRPDDGPQNLQTGVVRFAKFETDEKPFMGGIILSHGLGPIRHNLRISFQLQADYRVYSEAPLRDVASGMLFKMTILPFVADFAGPAPVETNSLQRQGWYALDHERSLRRKEYLEGFGTISFDVRAEHVLNYWDYVLRISVDSRLKKTTNAIKWWR